MNKKFLTLALTMGLFFATTAVAFADTVPIAQIMSQSGHSYAFDEVMSLESQCPVNYYVYEVYDNNENTGVAVSVGRYQWIGSDMTKGTVKIADANGNRVHAIITPAQYAAGQYPGGKTTPVATPKPAATPKPPTAAHKPPAAAPKPVVNTTPAKTAPSNTSPITASGTSVTPTTTTAPDGTVVPVTVNPADPTQSAVVVPQTPEQIASATELKAKMDEAKISIASYRSQIGQQTATTPVKKVGFWQRISLWFASVWAKIKSIF